MIATNNLLKKELQVGLMTAFNQKFWFKTSETLLTQKLIDPFDQKNRLAKSLVEATSWYFPKKKQIRLASNKVLASSSLKFELFARYASNVKALIPACIQKSKSVLRQQLSFWVTAQTTR